MTDPLLTRLQRALRDRYTVEHELGRGGMAVVFLGKDTRLDRNVAIKVFDRDSGAFSAGERFLREIRIAARLQHPNILPVFESGEADGLVYYVMPYVAGPSLRERIERGGALPLEECIRVAREVAEALDHAHRAGVVHRDIKPDNVLLADGAALVADFGIARAIQEGEGKVTDTGLAIGTPNYMSPEQIAADRNVDGRADIYALGCVLYEMLAGHPPFAGASSQDVMARHTQDEPPPLGTLRKIPPTLEHAVLTALAKNPADRWQSARELAQALSATATASHAAVDRPRMRRIGVVAAGVVASLLGVWYVSRLVAMPDDSAAPLRSVAMLPVAVQGDSSLNAIADGLTDAVITGLVRLEGLRVPASNRVFAYRGRHDDFLKVGKELGVESVVAATIQHFNGRIRLNAQLINVSDGLVIWSEQFDGDTRDLFAMQDSISVHVVDALRPQLTPAGRAVVARGVRTRDTVALRLYLEARRLTQLATSLNYHRQDTLLRQAIARDSGFADAWVALAHATQYLLVEKGTLPVEMSAQVRKLVDHAIYLDNQNAEALVIRGRLRGLWHEWDWEGSRNDLTHAMRLAPSSTNVLQNYSWLLAVMNEPDSALHYSRLVLEREPDRAGWLGMLAFRYMALRQLDSAKLVAERAMAKDSSLDFAHTVLRYLYVRDGRMRDAEAIAARLRRDVDAGDQWPLNLSDLAQYYAHTGRPEEALKMVKRLDELSRRGYVSPSAIAVARLAIGDTAGAVERIEEARRYHDEFLVLMMAYGYFRALDGHERYQAVRRHIFGNRTVPQILIDYPDRSRSNAQVTGS